VIYDQLLPSNVEAQIKSICSVVPSFSVSQETLEAATYLFDKAYHTVSSAYWTCTRDSLDLLTHYAIPPAYIGQLDITGLSIFDRLDKTYAWTTTLWGKAGNLDDELDKHLEDVAQNYGINNTKLPTTSP
jgi:hypothetical protein